MSLPTIEDIVFKYIEGYASNGESQRLINSYTGHTYFIAFSEYLSKDRYHEVLSMTYKTDGSPFYEYVSSGALSFEEAYEILIKHMVTP